MAVVLLVLGIFMGLYSPWLQERLKEKIVLKLNENPDLVAKIGKFSLKFPLGVDIRDVLFVSHGDTLLEAGVLKTNVRLLPLLKGSVDVDYVDLQNARYQIGARDSAMCMIIAGKTVSVSETQVKLSPMDIHVTKIFLDDANVNMYINPADTFPVTPPTPPTDMKINVDEVSFRSLKYEMELMPTIYRLKADIGSGGIDSISVNLLEQTVGIGNFKGNELNATYLMPDSAQIANTLVIVNDKKEASEPWTIKINNIDMKDSQALYTTFGVEPLPGLDFNYIQVDNLDLSIRNFYNRQTVVRLPLAVSGHERCGIDLSVNGSLEIDSTGIAFNDFHLQTASRTNLSADGYMGTLTPLTSPETPIRLSTEGEISVADIDLMFPAFKPLLAGLRKGAEIENRINIYGTTGNLDIEALKIKIDRHFQFGAKGRIVNVFTPDKMSGNISFDGSVTDISHWTADLLADTGILIPTIKMSGKAVFNNQDYKAEFRGQTNGGTIAMKGSFVGHGDKYSLNLNTDELPVNAFMPKLGIGRVTLIANAEGQGFDFFKKSTQADVSVDIKKFEYNNETYGNVSLTAKVGDDHATIVVDSYNSGLDFHLDARGAIESDKYAWTVGLNTTGIDLYKLGLGESESTLAADLTMRADISSNLHDIDAILSLNSAEYNTPESDLSIDRAKVILSTSDTLTNLSAQNRDFYAFFSTPLPIDSIVNSVDKVTAVLDYQYKNHIIDIPEIQRAVMPFTFDIEAGGNNALIDLLAKNKIRFKNLSVLASNDTSMYLTAKVLDFSMNDIRLDTIDFDIRQVGNMLDYKVAVNNEPGTFDQWAHVNVNGYFNKGKLGINLLQKNIKDKVGFDFGATLSLNRDSTMTLHFEPYQPIINYQKWSLNEDNFVSFDFKHYHLDADLMMKSDVSRLALYTEHANDTVKAVHGADEDLVLQLFDIRIQDWIALDPFAPPLKGDLSAGLRVNWQDNRLNGTGTVDVTDLYYGKEKVGDFNLDLGLVTDADGMIKANAEMWVNDQKTITLNGVLNDSTRTTPFNLDLTMIHLPLSVANPFLPGIARLKGSLNGALDIEGSASQPIMNGYLAFEDATVDITMLGSTFTLNRDTIPVKENLIKFNDFKIKGVNENPLRINGDVNLESFASPSLSLKLNADNMQIVNTNRARKGAEIYGKAFIGLNATAKGNLDVLNVNADLSLLPGTNVTYILAGGASAIENQAAGSMVKFVNFADTAAVEAADSIKIEGMILNLNANLNIQTGTVISVDLGTNAQDRVQLQGSGTFNYVSSPVGSGRLTGRYTFSGGFIKYAPPLISNLNFGFTPGSYVAFTGDITNPQLNVKAVEQMRANVSQAGQNSRLIYFDIILSVTGSLDNMNVAFNLQTDDDVTVANELASMSPTQRASEAMNLLLYNTYTGGSTKATSNLNGNPLFSFLTNSVNSWLANNVRGVDLSIGVDQYDQSINGNTSTTTSYSYRVSKTLFNDRIKIIVGGSYSNDPTEDGSVAENLINDISVEYFLNNARTMYLRLFRHTGYESILEGEITQTGVGFVYKKRISRISDMFIPSRFRHHKNAPVHEETPQPEAEVSKDDKADAPTEENDSENLKQSEAVIKNEKTEQN